jgi:hypothetical protein
MLGLSVGVGSRPGHVVIQPHYAPEVGNGFGEDLNLHVLVIVEDLIALLMVDKVQVESVLQVARVPEYLLLDDV